MRSPISTLDPLLIFANSFLSIYEALFVIFSILVSLCVCVWRGVRACEITFFPSLFFSFFFSARDCLNDRSTQRDNILNIQHLYIKLFWNLFCPFQPQGKGKYVFDIGCEQHGQYVAVEQVSVTTLYAALCKGIFCFGRFIFMRTLLSLWVNVYWGTYVYSLLCCLVWNGGILLNIFFDFGRNANSSKRCDQ